VDFFIRLDNKGRLVLPLEIREALGLEKNGTVSISVSAGRGRGSILLDLSKCSEASGGVPYSKNGRYQSKKPKRCIP
jgi:bifunctional DNA-binding transcriptional regulator/antitoxin component of YhaV-PrlF toxin-antitoxin module